MAALTWITPTDKHGPIAGRKTGQGEWERFEPGQPFLAEINKAQALVEAGKAVFCDEPEPETDETEEDEDDRE